MNMREQFVKTTNELIETNENVAVLLGGISVASFHESMEKHPNRVFDAGILEQSIVSVAAGMAICGMIPILHTIAPFVVERAHEQIKIDFGYQKLGGNFVTTGASLDYSSFGATHQCPADVGLLKQIPNIEIVVPGTADEFDSLFRANYANGNPTYYRLSRDVNRESRIVKFGQAYVVKKGKAATVIAVGPMLEMILEACKDKDVTILYYTTVEPFDRDTLLANCPSEKILICEPYYKGALLYDIYSSFHDKKVQIADLGISHEFASHYGYTTEHYKQMGLTVENIRLELEKLIQS